jgi:hypothetical protein
VAATRGHSRPLLVSHWVNNVVDADAEGQRGEGLRVSRIIGPLPGIAKVHVVAYGYLDAAFVIVNGTPSRRDSVFLVSPSGKHIL